MAIRQSSARIGSSLDDIIDPYLLVTFPTFAAFSLWLGSVFLLLSMTFMVILVFFETIHLKKAFKSNNYLKNHFKTMRSQSLLLMSPNYSNYGSINTPNPTEAAGEVFDGNETPSLQKVNTLTTKSLACLHSKKQSKNRFSDSQPNIFKSVTPNSLRPKMIETDLKRETSYNNDNENNFKDDKNKSTYFTNLAKSFPFPYWILAVCGLSMHGTMITWNEVAAAELTTLYSDYTLSKASNLLTMFWILTAVLTPFGGIILDRFGHKCELLIASGIVICGAHFCMFIEISQPIVVVILLSLGYSIFPSAITSCVAITIDRKHLGFAYGVMTALFNFTMTLYPMIIGNILDAAGTGAKNVTRGYKLCELVFMGVSLISIILGVTLYIDDVYYRPTRKLTLKPKRRRTSSDLDNRHRHRNSTERYWISVIETPQN